MVCEAGQAGPQRMPPVPLPSHALTGIKQIMDMQYEVEQKFAVAEIAPLREGLLSLGAVFKAPCLQCDRYLAHPCKSFAETDEALRIRMVGETSYVTYKGPRLDSTIKTRREVELPLGGGLGLSDGGGLGVSDGGGLGVSDNFTELFELLGFTVVREVRKQRTATHVMWEGTRVEAVIDEVEQLGTFAELEVCVPETETGKAKATIHSLAQRLGLANVEPRSYLEMLLASHP